MLAKRYSTHLRRRVDATSEVAVTVGASQALYLTLQALVNPGDEVVGTLNMEQVSAIAEVKKGDAHLANIPFEALCDSVIGTARSMGVLLADDVDDASSSSSSSSDEDDDGEPKR